MWSDATVEVSRGIEKFTSKFYIISIRINLVLYPYIVNCSLQSAFMAKLEPNTNFSLFQTKRDLEKLVDELNDGRPQCPVGLNTLVIPRKVTLSEQINQPYVYLKCGHVQGIYPTVNLNIQQYRSLNKKTFDFCE